MNDLSLNIIVGLRTSTAIASHADDVLRAGIVAPRATASHEPRHA